MRRPPVEPHRAERVADVWQLNATSHQRLGMAIQSVGIAVSAVPGPVRSILRGNWRLNEPHPLADGTPVSWLSLIDEHRGTVLESRAFSPIRL